MRPVFIGGCPRSGTTLLGSMLGAHSDCLCVPESGFKKHFLQTNHTHRNASDLLRMFGDQWRFKVWGIEVPEIPSSQVLRQSERSSTPRCQPTIDRPESAFAEAIECVVRKYGEHVGKSDAGIWVDHTPSNTRHGATLLQLFPGAKFVHMVRDGRAVAASVLPLDWGPNTVDEAARWWMEHVAFGLAAESWGGARRVLRVRYEALVVRPETVLAELAAFLEIDYQSAMVEARGFRVPEYTAQQHSLVGQRPDASRVNGWEKSLTPRQVEIFESITGGMLEYLNYQPKFGVAARKITNIEKHTAHIYGVCRRRILNRLRFRSRKRKINAGSQAL
jgi:hypothetical protein